ncbi:DUF7845 domain-containing protein [Halolamina salifodinae]|uniref:DUF7845 domain-containing protein n=1 Tax=Halolamina salifodinae TaxID=1202767 RepID=A0A8T4GW73_9EURY|nr:Lrp/AsnC family transcriptional regulator [Halolamina salifodinae]MBP1985934.1 hypothetical protein [Halolamina salifodinae]
MTSDEFDLFEDAEPVTTDGEDSIDSQVWDHEAKGERYSADSDGVDAGDRVTKSELEEQREQRHQNWESNYVAGCRHCRVYFETREAAEQHEGSCPQEPRATCRYCQEDLERRDDVDDHYYQCDEFRNVRKQQQAAANRNNSDAGRDFFDLRAFIDPQPHEFAAYLKFDTGLASYFGLNSLQKEHDFERLGAFRETFEDVDGKEWAIEFRFKGSGIAPRDHPDFRLEEVREYQVYVYPTGYEQYEDAKAEDRKRAYFRISPRWPEIETVEDAAPMSNPHDILGYDVEVKGSYFEFGRYPHLLQDALSRLRERQGFRFNSPTLIDPDAFAPEKIHESSNIVDAELYVRVKDGETGKVFAFDGSLHRVSMLLGQERRGYAKSVRDDREKPGHYHTATIGPERAAELLGGHQYAKELKHYHVKNPDAVSGTALENPKIGSSLQHSLQRDTVYWDDLERLDRELDEALLNVLEWSGLPVRADHQIFVDDDYFEVRGRRRFRKLVYDQLPRIRAQQNRGLEAVVGNLNETDVRMLDTLLTDGGEFTMTELAGRIDRALGTVSTAIDRLGALVTHDRATGVELGSKYLAQEIVQRIEGWKDSVNMTTEAAVDRYVDAGTFGDGETAWDRWLDHYVGSLDRSQGRSEMEIGYEPETRQDAKRLIRQGALKWAEAHGRPVHEFAKEFSPVVRTQKGDKFLPGDWWIFREYLPYDISPSKAFG